MVASFIVLPVLLVSGALMVQGGVFGSLGGLAGFGGGGGGYGGGGYVSPYSGGGNNYQCGGVQCVTTIQCDSCDYPQPFVQQVSYSRSVLTRVEEFVQSVGRVAINAGTRLANTAVSIPAGFVEMSMKNGMMLVSDISTAIENLNTFVSHQVVGRIAYDVVADLSDSLSTVRKLVGWCGTVNNGNSIVQIPQSVITRYQEPPSWNNQCTGNWPCSTLVPFTSSQGAQSQYANKFGYSKQYNRGNTQIVNSNYDSGNAYGYGDTGAQAQNYNYLTGSFPSSNAGGGGYGAGLLGGYGSSGARALGGAKKLRKARRKANH